MKINAVSKKIIEVDGKKIVVTRYSPANAWRMDRPMRSNGGLCGKIASSLPVANAYRNHV